MTEKHVFFFNWVGNEPKFTEVLTKGGEIKLTKMEYDTPEDEVQAVLNVGQGYHIRGNRTALPQHLTGDKQFIERCPNLLAICTTGAGYDVVDVDDCTEAGVLVCNQRGLNAEGVAEHAFGMMLALIRKMPQADKAMRRDPNLKRPDYHGNNISRKTCGIYGLGGIGTKLASYCKAFDMRVIAAHPRLTPEQALERGAELVDFDTMLAESDFIVAAAPQTAETTGMFDYAAFKKMKKTAFFVNIARAGLQVEEDLVKALEEGEIAGCGMDVFEVEPPSMDHPLLKFENVLATPHTAGPTPENWDITAAGAAEQWHDILAGRRPPRIVNYDVWPKYRERFKRIMGFDAAE